MVNKKAVKKAKKSKKLTLEDRIIILEKRFLTMEGEIGGIQQKLDSLYGESAAPDECGDVSETEET